jgi:hypothetical protein
VAAAEQLLFLEESLAHAQFARGGAEPISGLTVAPPCRLDVEIDEIDEGAGGKETLAHIPNRAFDAPLLIATRRRDGSRFKAIVASELQQRWIKANRIALPFQHRTF